MIINAYIKQDEDAIFASYSKAMKILQCGIHSIFFSCYKITKFLYEWKHFQLIELPIKKLFVEQATMQRPFWFGLFNENDFDITFFEWLLLDKQTHKIKGQWFSIIFENIVEKYICYVLYICDLKC